MKYTSINDLIINEGTDRKVVVASSYKDQTCDWIENTYNSKKEHYVGEVMNSTECIILVQKICNTATIANYQIDGKRCYCQWGTDMRPNPGAGYINCLLKPLKKSGK